MRCSKGWLVLGLTLGLGAGLGGCKSEPEIGPEPGRDSGPLTRSCPADRGAPMALLPAIDGSSYCMDVRETTRAEYDAFVAAKGGDVSGQPKECDWNERYTPELHYPGNDTPPPLPCPAEHWNNMRPNQAVTCVDFCDAYAYCAWAGKRLCGVTGAGQGISKMGEHRDDKPVSVDSPSLILEFSNACSQGGKTKYSYGDTYEPGRCMDAQWLRDRGPESLDVTDTASRRCNGTTEPFDEVYDLSGGVREWQNFCLQDQTLTCMAKGYGLWDVSGEAEPCENKDSIALAGSNSISWSYGIRCCADAVR